MKLKIALTFSIVMVALCAGVMGREFLDTLHFKHWLRAVPPPDDCTAPGDLIQDPRDCHNFYVCHDADNVLPNPQTCPEEYDCFDPTTMKCIVEDGTTCADFCAGATSECTFECPADGSTTVVAKQEDCTKFIICFASITKGHIEQDCPPDNPYFNGAECVTDQAECCTCQDPVCSGTMFELFPDPKNCHAYYECLDLDGDGSFDLLGPTTCPNNGSFIDTNCDGTTTECENACGLGIRFH